MSASDLKRKKEMEAELSRLKRMYADLAVENQAMNDLIEKNSMATGEAGSGQVHDRTPRSIGGP
jgi:putative transposase